MTASSGEERKSHNYFEYIMLKVSFEDGENRHLQDLEGSRVEAETHG